MLLPAGFARDPLQENFIRLRADLVAGLADAGDGGVEVVEVVVVVERDERDVVRNAQFHFAHGFERTQQNRVAQREDGRGPLSDVQRPQGLFVPVADREPVARDAGVGAQPLSSSACR